MTSAFGPTLSTAQRVVDRVHSRTPHCGPNTHPPGTASLPDRHILVLDITDLADGRRAGEVDQFHFT